MSPEPKFMHSDRARFSTPLITKTLDQVERDLENVPCYLRFLKPEVVLSYQRSKKFEKSITINPKKLPLKVAENKIE